MTDRALLNLYRIPLLTTVFLSLFSVCAFSASTSENMNCLPGRTFCTVLEFSGDENELWIFYQASPKKRRLLSKINRYADVIFSPDEKWLLVNDYFGSNASEVLLFQHESGLKFTHLDQIDITGQSWDLFEAAHPFADDTIEFVNQYIKAVEWSADSSAFLLILAGSTTTDYDVRKWFLVFDMHTRQPTTNLQLINRGAIGKD